MNWLKPMLLMIVLGGILYGVYTVLNKGPATDQSAAGSRDWPKPPEVQPGTADNGRGGPPPMPIGNPDVRMESAATGPQGQAALPRLVYPSNPAPGDQTAAGGSVYGAGQGNGSSANPVNRNDAAPRQSGPGADITSGNEPPRGDPGAAAVIGPRADDPSARETFASALQNAKGMLSEGKLVEALRYLTKWHNNSQLTPDESRQLIELLSQLAGTVVYSRQHMLQPPYKVQPGDRLETIAAQYNVPWQLLAKINGIEDPNRLNAGDDLKVLRGPFSAIVDLDKRQLTLIVDDCYAGRFNLVGVGDLARNIEGRSFEVGEKSLKGPVPPTGNDGSPIHHWVRLGNETWIVGTSDLATIHPAGLNLNSRDAEDVYDILSVGSRVVVRR